MAGLGYVFHPLQSDPWFLVGKEEEERKKVGKRSRCQAILCPAL
jgi:hypothetical protein